MAATSAELLNLDGISLRSEGVRFDLLDQGNQYVGEIHPVATCRIENNTSQGTKRRLSNFRLTASEAVDVNPLQHRVRPWWLLENGAEFSLGIFLFGNASNPRRSWGTETQGTLVDQGLILSQQLRATAAFQAGTLVTDALRTVAETAGIVGARIDASSASLGAPLVWPAGKSATTYLKVLEDLCKLAGFHPPYFDNNGVLVCRTLQDPSSVVAELEYVDGGRIIAESAVEANDLLEAPNLYVIVDTAATTNPVTFEYELPATAPHSYARRGFYIPKTVEAPGIANVDQARALAQTMVAADVTAFETVHFMSPADPRHDTFDVVNYRGVNYLELSWSLTLAPGGPMEHELKRVFL